MKKYSIFDISAPLLMDYPISEGNNAREALENYLKSKNKLCKLKRGGKNPHYQLTQFEEVPSMANPIKYKKGRVIWFEKISPLELNKE